MVPAGLLDQVVPNWYCPPIHANKVASLLMSLNSGTWTRPKKFVQDVMLDVMVPAPLTLSVGMPPAVLMR